MLLTTRIAVGGYFHNDIMIRKQKKMNIQEAYVVWHQLFRKHRGKMEGKVTELQGVKKKKRWAYVRTC